MAEAVHFEGANFRFMAPPGRDDICDLHTFRQPDGPANVSCWHLAGAELREVCQTGRVFLAVMSGTEFYPAFVGSENVTRGVLADCGSVWKRGTAEEPTDTPGAIGRVGAWLDGWAADPDRAWQADFRLVLATAIEAERLRTTLVEAAIPLEALLLSGLDRMSPEMGEGVRSAVASIRAALGVEITQENRA